MPDPVSISASVIGILGVTLHAIHLLWDDVKGIKDAPEEIGRLKEDLQEVISLLERLNKVTERSKQDIISAEVRDALRVSLARCDVACGKFREKLRHWTKRSGDGPMHWLDRAYTGTLGQKHLQLLFTRIEACKSTIIAATSTANLAVSMQSAQTAVDSKETLLTIERRLARQMQELDDEKEVVDMEIDDVQNLQEDKKEAAKSSDFEEVLEEADQAKHDFEAHRKVFEELFKRTHEQRTGQVINDVKALDSLIGAINVEQPEKLDLLINKVHAKSSVVGVANEVNVSDFFRQKDQESKENK